jgi:serine/threonine-protein kinase
VRLLVERALAKDPADRFADGGAFAEAIRRVAAGGSLAAAAAAPPTAPVPVVDPVADGRTQVFGAATGAALAAGAAGGGAAATRAAGPAPATGPAGPMPPLEAPDEYDWEQGEPPPARRSRRGLWIAVAAIVVLLLAGGAWFLLGPAGDAGNEAGRTPTSSAAESTASAVTIDLQAYLGQDADDVQADLEERGFTVTRADASEATVAEGTEIAGRELAAGQVADIAPAGENVPTTATVTLYVVPEAAPDSGAGDTGEQTPAPTTSSAPTTTTAPPTTTSSAPTTTAPPTTSSPTLSASTPPETPPPPADPPPADEEADPNAGANDPDGSSG